MAVSLQSRPFRLDTDEISRKAMLVNRELAHNSTSLQSEALTKNSKPSSPIKQSLF